MHFLELLWAVEFSTGRTGSNDTKLHVTCYMYNLIGAPDRRAKNYNFEHDVLRPCWRPYIFDGLGQPRLRLSYQFVWGVVYWGTSG